MARFDINQVQIKMLDHWKAFQSQSAYNAVFRLWLEVWEQVFGEKNLEALLDPDDFFRQEVVISLWHEAELIGFIMGTKFDLNLDHHCLHSYPRSLNPQIIKKIRESQTPTFLSLEYLTIKEKFRRSKTDFSFAEILISLMGSYQKENEISWCIGTPRADVKVDFMAEKMGLRRLGQSLLKYDYPCEVVGCRLEELKQHPDQKHLEAIQAIMNRHLTEHVNSNKAA